MSEITIMCPYCGESLTGDSDFLGEEVGCPDCGNTFIAKKFAESFEESEPVSADSRTVSASLKKFRFNPEAFKKINAIPDEGLEAQQDPNDSVFTDTERGVKRPAAFRRQTQHNPGFSAGRRGAMRPSAPRRQPEKSARFSGGSTPAGKSVSTVGRKQKSFDQLLGLANAPRVFKLTSWFWIFFCFGAILFSIGVSYVLNASEYDGEFKDWGGTRIYQLNPSRKGDPSSDPSFAAAKNTAVICEGLKYINRNFSNVGSHYQGLHEMFIGFTLIFGSGFFFFCALIAFLYSARMPAKE